ncbi:hypothetical protein BH23PAT1_BH23PAT1_0570 [soil metagenome]
MGVFIDLEAGTAYQVMPSRAQDAGVETVISRLALPIDRVATYVEGDGSLEGYDIAEHSKDHWYPAEELDAHHLALAGARRINPNH